MASFCSPVMMPCFFSPLSVLSTQAMNCPWLLAPTAQFKTRSVIEHPDAKTGFGTPESQPSMMTVASWNRVRRNWQLFYMPKVLTRKAAICALVFGFPGQ